MHSYGTDLPIMHQSNISMFCKLNTGALLVSAFVAPTTAALPLDETHLTSASFHLLPSDHPRVGAILLRYDGGRGLVMHCAILGRALPFKTHWNANSWRTGCSRSAPRLMIEWYSGLQPFLRFDVLTCLRYFILMVYVPAKKNAYTISTRCSHIPQDFAETKETNAMNHTQQKTLESLGKD